MPIRLPSACAHCKLRATRADARFSRAARPKTTTLGEALNSADDECRIGADDELSQKGRGRATDSFKHRGRLQRALHTLDRARSVTGIWSRRARADLRTRDQRAYGGRACAALSSNGATNRG